ncbi:hypothetical protein GBO89_02340 [Pediococcus pentosaceus]|uniref:hypothetical protein n=1 Tax=Pediococcus pentosaceus TaxID=1255 RepID=UPI00132FB7F1|nr:hypothetical protein [Pediococcus pentosaceus]KAF0435823.1 hypothetical protein GBO89_02340 [Pediococcus pentosaceus]MDV6381156.1 hypothetical protein [Pediococcus pentosaceus]
MENVYVVRLGNLYLKESSEFMSQMFYTLVNFVSGAEFYDEDEAKELAKQIGGEAYKINLEEVE